MGLRFLHSGAHTPAINDFDKHLSNGTDGIRLAVCFFLKAGLEILRRHTVLLSHSKSFVVVSLDRPTDLDAVDQLHRLIPGRVFIHLGWVTPEEKKGGSALMHSKVCLTQRGDERGLWVGSHNLTASAMGGANIEAAMVYETSGEDAVIADAEQHLRECRDTAEPYDPTRLDEYKKIQDRKAGMIGIQNSIVVLHAEEHAQLKGLPAIIHVRLPTTDFDALTKTDSTVHFFLHQPGALNTSPVIRPTVRRFTGRIIEDNRTEHHPSGGSASIMSKATHWLEFGQVPALIMPNSSKTTPLTQAAILLDPDAEESRADGFLYSIKERRSRSEAASTLGNLRTEDAPLELLPFFSPRSVENQRLLFAPREHMRETGRMSVYKGTPIPERFIRNMDRPNETGRGRIVHERQSSKRVELEVIQVEPQLTISPYFFKSSFCVRTDDDRID